MRIALILAACCIAACLAEPKPAISEIKAHENKAGRFLTLPIPEKCASRKFCFYILLFLWEICLKHNESL